ncbi:uncharacterized protein Tco025E_07683 [Trypanosoma conorhini]|uniref:Uncharacterized protein n=1 Tax=Trypanosoma conorhini TaxID=83891 RepID=A0A422NKA6_9TRYP|nr:uncharacterized protein Tco025E_07683 [Trypanosoma conorhini]RNF05930.1 hypothetical protein Tco025E_07683 [Trypanosoma conorhini]
MERGKVCVCVCVCAIHNKQRTASGTERAAMEQAEPSHYNFMPLPLAALHWRLEDKRSAVVDGCPHLLWVLQLVIARHCQNNSQRQHVRVVPLECLKHNMTRAQVLFIGIAAFDVLAHAVKRLL